MTLFIMTLFFLGYYAESVSKVQAAAADAARMASVQYQTSNVRSTARLAAWSDLSGTCNRDSRTSLPVSWATMNIALPGNPPAGTTSAQSTTHTIKVTVTCDVRVLGVSYSITESSYAPLDFFGGQQ